MQVMCYVVRIIFLSDETADKLTNVLEERFYIKIYQGIFCMKRHPGVTLQIMYQGGTLK